jgi:hypothetical protein
MSFPVRFCGGLLLVAGLLFASSGSARAQGGGGGASGDGGASGSGGGGGLQLASEAIGTLPTWWVDDAAPLLSMPVATQTDYQLEMHLEGWVPEALLEQFVDDAYGDGYVFLSLPPNYSGLVRVRFFGDIHLELNRAVVTAGGIALDIRTGVANVAGQGFVSVGGTIGDPFALAAVGGGLPLPLGSSPSFDALFEAQPIQLYTVTADGSGCSSGWDVGRMSVGADNARYLFDLEVLSSLLP